MNKTSATEWLGKEILQVINLKISSRDKRTLIESAIQQAKEYEKEQIINAYHEGYDTRSAYGDNSNNISPEQYYSMLYEKK